MSWLVVLWCRSQPLERVHLLYCVLICQFLQTVNPMNQAEHCWERENLQRGFVEQELAMLLELVLAMVLELPMGMALLLTVVFFLELVTVEVAESPLF